jgi:DNA-binding transcriptional MerR regulator
MTESRLTIGALAAGTACSVPTIRYYEQIGLLPRPERAANGHRYYRAGDLKRLGFIKRCRDFGFPIEQVRELAALFDDGDRACVEVRALAQVHLDEVRRKLAEMRQLEKNLEAFVTGCNTACAGGPASRCVIIEDLSPRAMASREISRK